MNTPGAHSWLPIDKAGRASLEVRKHFKRSLQYHARDDHCLNSSSSWQGIRGEMNELKDTNELEGHCV